jgi:PKD repeat protein
MGNTLLCKYNLSTSAETTFDLDTLVSGMGAMGLAVDQATGLLYITTGYTGDDLRVFDSNLNQKFQTALNAPDDPTGLCIPLEEIGYGYEPEPPVARFSATPTMGEAPLTAKFRDLSSGDIDSWYWSFGDGGSSRSRYPTHIYQNEGTYTVTLTVEGPAGRSSWTGSILVESTAAAPNLLVRNLNVTPAYAQPRQAVGITANVVNEGGVWGSATMELMINGQFEQSWSVGVAPGTAQPINFTVYKVEPGEYQVQIGDVTGTFHVMEEAAPPEEAQPGLLVGGELDTGGIIAIVVIGVIIVGGIVVAFLLIPR